MSTNIVGMVVAMNYRPVQESQYNRTLSWLLDGIFLNDTGDGTGTLQKGTVKIIVSALPLYHLSSYSYPDSAHYESNGNHQV